MGVVMHARLVRACLICVCAVGALLSVSAQQPGIPTAPGADRTRADDEVAAGTGTIRGRVVRADTQQPLERVHVSVSLSGGLEPREDVSDSDGRFELTDVPPGNYAVIARHDAFLRLSYGQRRVGDAGRRVAVQSGEIVEGVDFALPRGGVIDGIVVDDLGEPVPAVAVVLVRHRFVDGERQAVPWSALGGYADVTDDLGRFRLFGLMPGTYFLAAGRSSDPSLIPSAVSPSVRLETATFYPGTTAGAGAVPLEVVAGTEISGLSIPLVSAEAAAIRGVISGFAGTERPTVSLTRQTPVGDLVMAPARVQADGSFSFRGMAPGAYTIVARDSESMGVARVTHRGGDTIVDVPMRQGQRVHGRVEFVAATGGTPRPSQVQVRFRSMQVPRAVNVATWLDDGSFEVRGLVGAQRVEVSGTGAWSLSRVQQNGRTVTDEPIGLSPGGADSFVIELSDLVTRVTGQVRDARGRPDPEAEVVLFPEDPEKWSWGRRYVQAVRADQDGRFTIEALASGRYYAAASYLERGDEQDPEILRALSAWGQRLVLSHGESHALNLRARELP